MALFYVQSHRAKNVPGLRSKNALGTVENSNARMLKKDFPSVPRKKDSLTS
nr:MAG TPA: hypothetical protein [Caudoviricetes sp.]